MSASRPESPRRPAPSGPLEPINISPMQRHTSRPGSISSHHLHSPRPDSPYTPRSPIALPPVGPPAPTLADMHSWLGASLPSSVQSSVDAWCVTNAQPLLGGFLDGWMGINASAMLDHKISLMNAETDKRIAAMQSSIASLQAESIAHQAKIQSQASMIEKLQSTVGSQRRLLSEARTDATNQQSQQPPSPFTPTLPSSLTSPTLTSSPASSSSHLLSPKSASSSPSILPASPFSPTSHLSLQQQQSGASGGATLGLGFGRKSFAAASGGGGLGIGGGGRMGLMGNAAGAGGQTSMSEDGVDAAMNPQQLIRNRMSQGNPLSMKGGGIGVTRVVSTTVRGVTQQQGGEDVLMPLRGSPTGTTQTINESSSSSAPSSSSSSAGSSAKTTSGNWSGMMTGAEIVNARASQSGGSGGGGQARSRPSGAVDIIVVEDLGVAQKIAHAALTRGHFKVDIAGDGLTAIELFKMHMGSLKAVLMDIHLPGISGIETTERIRIIERELGSVPVWIYGLTGDVADDDLAKYKACGMNGCILKGKLLADAVKQAMEESNAGVEFVNLCDKQSSSSSSSSTSSAGGSSASTPLMGTSPMSISSRMSPGSVGSSGNVSGSDSHSPVTSPLQTGAHPNSRATMTRAMIDRQSRAGSSLVPDDGTSNVGGVGGTSPLMGGIRPNLLLVEDLRVSQKVASAALTRATFKVIVADNGEAAVEKYKQHAASLRIILMDINLPGISGIEATEQIRALESSLIAADPSLVPVLIFGLTGNVEPESMKHYDTAGMNGCILKGKQLADAVKQAVESAARDSKFVNIS